MSSGALSSGRQWAMIGGVYAALVVAALGWLAVDRRPPEWDHANHLERAIRCERDLQAGDVDALIERSSFYPPLVTCAAGMVYRLVPSDVLAAQSVVLAFLGLGMAATYLLARRLADGPTGVLAALVFGTAPFVVFSSLRFQLDLPLAAMVAFALWALHATDGFARPGWSLVFGVIVGLGMLTKPPFAAYVAAPIVLVAVRARGLRVVLNGGLALVIAAALSLPWYGPRLAGLPFQIGSRSFTQAAESGHPDPLTWAGLSFYPRWLPSELGLVATVLLVLGLIVGVRRRQWFPLVAFIGPFLLFEVLQNKNLRYILPLFPLAAALAAMPVGLTQGRVRAVLAGALVVVGVLQVSGTAFSVPPARPLPGVGVPWDSSPPSRADWRHRDVLAVISRHSGGRSATVSVVPNSGAFSVSNFRYYALRDGLPLRFVRAWDDAPLGIEYMILKSGDQGPSWTTEKPRRIAAELRDDPYLARAFPVIGEFGLPDGSTATVRARAVPDVTTVRPADLAERIEAALRRAIPDFAREVDGLDIRLTYGSSVRRGHLQRIEIEARAATVGELRRRAAATLSVHDLRLVVDDVLVNSESALGAARFDLLDARRIAIERATIRGEDLQRFLGSVKRPKHVSMTLAAGDAFVRIGQFGPDLTARVRIIPATDRPFALEADRVRVGPLGIPSTFVNWVVRNFDPSPRLAARLPIRVELGRITIAPDAIRITPAGEGMVR